jgi:hypothetical protein
MAESVAAAAHGIVLQTLASRGHEVVNVDLNPGSGENPKISWIDDAGVVGDLVAVDVPIPGTFSHRKLRTAPRRLSGISSAAAKKAYFRAARSAQFRSSSNLP